jgi:rhodanese-related sulfurtransferase
MRIFITSIALIGLIFSGCVQSSKNDSATVDAERFEQMINQSDDRIILDVRTPEEFAIGHIPGAVLVNINDSDFDTKVNGLDKSKTMLVYCGSGVRSDKAVGILKESGFKKVYHLENGMKACNMAKKEVTTQ